MVDGCFRWMLATVGTSVTDVLVLGCLLIGAALVLGLAVLLLRRWMLRRLDDASGGADRGFPMDALDELRRGGQLSDEEFAAIRRRALGLSKTPAQESDSSVRLPEPSADEDTGNESDPNGPGDKERE